ncbi:MAG: folate-binding protein, partial [Micrococcales bacterium]|nr:folate-binding protein [Micrococcales bacterium]
MPNPNQEQKDLLAGLSYVSLDKKVLEISGTDRLTWLNDMLSQKLDDLKPGQSVEALWLDAQGRVLRDFHILDDGDKTYLITFTEGFEAFLNSISR